MTAVKASRCPNPECQCTHEGPLYFCTKCDRWFCDNCVGDVSDWDKGASQFLYHDFCPHCKDGGYIGQMGEICEKGDELTNEDKADEDDESEDNGDENRSNVSEPYGKKETIKDTIRGWAWIGMLGWLPTITFWYAKNDEAVARLFPVTLVCTIIVIATWPNKDEEKIN